MAKLAGGSDGSTRMPVASRPNGLAHAAGSQSDDRQARRHRLEHDVAESLGQAGKGKDVGGRVVIGEVFALPVACEVGDRADALLQGGARRTVAHQEEADTGPSRRHDRQRGGKIVDVFLGGDSAHVSDHHDRRPTSPGRCVFASGPAARAETASCRPRASTGPDARSQEPSSSALGRLRGDVGFAGAVVKPAQIAPDRRARPADAVMMAVLIEIGVKARDNGQPSPAARAGGHSTPASLRWRCESMSGRKASMARCTRAETEASGR